MNESGKGAPVLSHVVDEEAKGNEHLNNGAYENARNGNEQNAPENKVSE